MDKEINQDVQKVRGIPVEVAIQLVTEGINSLCSIYSLQPFALWQMLQQ